MNVMIHLVIQTPAVKIPLDPLFVPVIKDLKDLGSLVVVCILFFFIHFICALALLYFTILILNKIFSLQDTPNIKQNHTTIQRFSDFQNPVICL